MLKNIEQDLITALQPIRQMTLAICVNHFFETGIYRKLEKEATDAASIAKSLNLEQNRLVGFLNYLQNENLVAKDGDLYSVTAQARQLATYSAWYTMLVGGYTQTFVQIGDCLKGEGKWATRDVGKVGIGSCGISHYDAIPLTKRLMGRMDAPPKNLLDLGCGNAMYLVEFCKTMPGLTAYGVEPSKDACVSAEKIIDQEGLSSRVKVINKNVRDFINSDHRWEPDVMVLGFILHEILGQEGEAGLIDFLKTVTNRYPKMNLIVIEVDNQINNPTIMEHGLSKAYYNPYYLIHEFTEQQLTTDQWWRELFAKCELDIVHQDYPDNEVDSTRLEIGYLLKRRA